MGQCKGTTRRDKFESKMKEEFESKQLNKFAFQNLIQQMTSEKRNVEMSFARLEKQKLIPECEKQFVKRDMAMMKELFRETLQSLSQLKRQEKEKTKPKVLGIK